MPDENEEFNLEKLCSICHVTPDFVMELIAYGTIDARGDISTISALRFNARQISVIQTAVRLHEDLEVNHAGIALAIDLLKEMEELRNQVNILERYFLHK
jgi:chaperone modulatory protein CbpM